MKTSLLFLVSCLFGTIITKEIIIHTKSTEKLYNFFPLTTNYLEFKVKARTDIHIALTPSHAYNNTYYEICIGGWGNTKSEIRRNKANNIIATYKGKVINQDSFATYWIRKDDTAGSIEVGKGKGTYPLMRAVDSDYKRMKFFGISTGFGSKGVWIINPGATCDRSSVENTDKNLV